MLFRREGWPINVNKTYRIYKEMGMQLRNKTPKRRVKAKLREDRQVAIRPNDIWAMDFVQDQLATDSVTVGRMSFQRLDAYAGKSVIRNRSVPIREASLCPKTWTCGPTSTA